MSFHNKSLTQSRPVRLKTVALFKRDDFEELGQLGEGFFSRVLKLQHKASKKFFVLKLPKVLPAEDSHEQELAKASLLHEMQVLQRLNHPNVLRLVGQCVDGEMPNMLIEYANRETLEALLADKQVVLDTVTRVRLALEIADALAYLHSNGVFHKDLSSKNILIRDRQDGQSGLRRGARFSAIIADLGLAMCHRSSIRRSASSEDVFEPKHVSSKQQADTCAESKHKLRTVSGASRPSEGASPRASAASSSSLDSSGSMSEGEKELLGSSEYGSTWWKAPEQILGGDDTPYTDRADVYSLGILLAELVTRLPAVPDPGLIPRHDSNFGFALDFDKFRVHPQVPADAPPQLISLIGACCQVEPTRRPSAKQVEAALRRVLADFTRKSLVSQPPADATADNHVTVSQPTCATELSLRSKPHRTTSKAKNVSLNKPNRQHSERIAYDLGWNSKRERDIYRTLRPVITQRFGTLESLKPRRRSASLSRVAADAPAEM